mgnify:CR=1 FL=1
MEPNAENSCRRDEIKEKLRQNFDGKIVRKDLTKKDQGRCERSGLCARVFIRPVLQFR